MRILTKTGGVDWLKKSNLREIHSPFVDPDFVRDASYAIPGDAGRKTALSRLIANLMDPADGEGLLWIWGHGIWPSSENQALFRALRTALGQQTPLDEAPCHTFTASDKQELECVLDLVLYFSWDASLLSPRQGLILCLSHDEVLDVYRRKEIQISGIGESFKQFGLTLLTSRERSGES